MSTHTLHIPVTPEAPPASELTKEEARAILDAGEHFARHLKDFEAECPVCTGLYKLTRIAESR